MATCGAAACGDAAEPDAARGDGSADAAPPFAGSASVDGAAPADAAAPPEGSCGRYCAEVTSSCVGPQAVYRSETECLGVCALLERGAVVEEGNTVGCRERFAGSPAKTDPTTFCPAAGPFGGGRCGDPCEAFCELTLGTCLDLAPYADVPSCERACAAYVLDDAGAPDADADDGDGGEAGAPSRGTLDCRMDVLRRVWASTSTCSDLGDAGPCGAP